MENYSFFYSVKKSGKVPFPQSDLLFNSFSATKGKNKKLGQEQ